MSFTLYGESYRVADVLGEGRYGEVSKAQSDERAVAVKRFIPSDADLRAVYAREKRLLEKTVGCARVCRLIGGFEKHSCGYLVLELACGNVADKLRGLDRTVVGAHMISAVAALHACGVSHRDLRLENFLLVGHVVKIADLGLASDQQLMYTLEVQTWWYRAPELFLGQRPYTASVDLWALGLLLMHVWRDRAPYELDEHAMLPSMFRDRGVRVPSGPHELYMYGPSPRAEHPPMCRWHDCLAQLNPSYRTPIATLLSSDAEISTYAARSALLGSEPGAPVSALPGTAGEGEGAPARTQSGARGSRGRVGRRKRCGRGRKPSVTVVDQRGASAD